MKPKAGVFALREARAFSRVRFESLGLLDSAPEDARWVGTEAVVLGDSERAEVFMQDPETERAIRVVKVFAEGDVWHFGDDTRVVETMPPTRAGYPAQLVKLAADGTVVRRNNEGLIQWQNDTPDFIWDCEELHSAVAGLTDPEVAVETLVLAMAVAPPDVLPILQGALAQQYSAVLDFYEEFGDKVPKWLREDRSTPAP